MPHHLCRQGSLKIIEDAPSLAAWCRTRLIYNLGARTWWVSVNNHIRIWQRNGSSTNACLSMETSDRRPLNQRWFILPWKPTAQTWVSLSVVSDSLWPRGLQLGRLLHPWYFPGKNTGAGCHFLLQEIFPTQRWNPCLLHWQAGSLLSVPSGKKPYFIWDASIHLKHSDFFFLACASLLH